MNDIWNDTLSHCCNTTTSYQPYVKNNERDFTIINDTDLPVQLDIGNVGKVWPIINYGNRFVPRLTSDGKSIQLKEGVDIITNVSLPANSAGTFTMDLGGYFGDRLEIVVLATFVALSGTAKRICRKTIVITEQDQIISLRSLLQQASCKTMAANAFGPW